MKQLENTQRKKNTCDGYSIFFISLVASLLPDYLQSQVRAGYRLVNRVFRCEQLKEHGETVLYLKLFCAGNNQRETTNVSLSEELPISVSLSLEHLSFLCRREEESTDHEGGSVCPRKWMAVILP